MNSYNTTTTELFDLQKYAIKLGLDNITALCSAFGNPQNQYPVIHIAGTNGKGSTSFYIAHILQQCGLRVGLFTSPHLVDFRERIRINDKLIDKDYIIDFWADVKKNVLNLKATFFDTTSLLAFKYFADKKVDVAVFETGLGGRLDSTNIVNPESVVITPIGLDHQKQLGNDVATIAAEKAGIIKENSAVFVSEQVPAALNVIKKKINSKNKFYYLPEFYKTSLGNLTLNGLTFTLADLKAQTQIDFFLPTPADYQTDNFALAFFVCKEYCKNNQIPFNINQIKKFISKASWPGRLQIIQTNPTIIFDVSHNYHGIKRTIESLDKLTRPDNRHLLLGIVNDKDAYEITAYLTGKFKKITVTEPDTYRKQDGQLLLKLFESKQQNVNFIKDLLTAYEISKKELNSEDTLIALGSHYLIGKLLSG